MGTRLTKSRNARPPSAKPLSPLAWCWNAMIRPNGVEGSPSDPDALFVCAVSVNESLSSAIKDRCALIAKVVQTFAHSIPAGRPSLWGFPGGFFGSEWTGFHEANADLMLRGTLRSFPSNSTIILGADQGSESQTAWIVSNVGSSFNKRTVRRHETDLPDRRVQVGELSVGVFICGEMTGSQTQHNGPFIGEQYLDDPEAQLKQFDLVVDIAHWNVPKSVNGNPSPRYVHEIQMRRFSTVTAGLLVHHHDGRIVQGRAHYRDASNWMVFQGGDWLPQSRVRCVA